MTRPVHPEQTDDDVWIGNMQAADFKHVGWTTKRIGKRPQEMSGKAITTAGFRPVFVKRSEIEGAGVPIPDSGPVDHRW